MVRTIITVAVVVALAILVAVVLGKRGAPAAAVVAVLATPVQVPVSRTREQSPQAEAMPSAAPAQPAVEATSAAMAVSADGDLEKAVGSLTHEQAAKLADLAWQDEEAREKYESRFKLGQQHLILGLDRFVLKPAYEARQLALTADQVAQVNAVIQGLRSQMEAANVSGLTDQQLALKSQIRQLIDQVSAGPYTNMSGADQQKLKDQARQLSEQSRQIDAQLKQIMDPLNATFLSEAKNILTPAQNQALQEYHDKTSGGMSLPSPHPGPMSHPGTMSPG